MRAAAVILVALATTAVPAALRADGKFYFREPVPAKEPYQRAMLAWQEGQELLVVQPHLLGKAEDFAWVMPVPAEPEMGAMRADMAWDFFDDLAEVSQPHGIPISVIPAFVLLLILVVLPFTWRRIPSKHFLTTVVALGCFGIACGFFVPTFLRGRGPPPDDDGVTVLSSEKLGIYDTQVVRSNRPGALKDWLAKNGYRFAAEDDGIIRAYEEKGWCFVTSKIALKLEKDQIPDGMIDALVLTFASQEPVYPFALTATSGYETQVLLYALADHKLVHPAMELKFAGPATWNRLNPESWRSTEDDPEPPLPAYSKTPGYLTKLKGRLSKKNVAGDLVLTQAPDDAPYRGMAFRW